MTGRRVRMTPERMSGLMDDLRGLPTEFGGEHLTDEQFIEYATETLTGEALRHAEEHLAGCAACALEVERLVTAAEAWRTAEGQQRLDALRRQALGLATPRERLAAMLGRLVLSTNVALERPQALLAAPWPARVDGQTEDGTLRWRITPGPADQLVVRLGSHALELEGSRLRLKAGEWRTEVVLRRVAPDQVGEEIVIAREVRAQLPFGTPLSIELVGEED